MAEAESVLAERSRLAADRIADFAGKTEGGFADRIRPGTGIVGIKNGTARGHDGAAPVTVETGKNVIGATALGTVTRNQKQLVGHTLAKPKRLLRPRRADHCAECAVSG